MSKSLSWILVAALCVSLALNIHLWNDGSNKDFDIYRTNRQADSLRTVNAQLSDSVDVHKLNASKANAIADSLMKTDPQVIVDERLKLNRYATAEKVGEGLVKKLP